MQPLENPHCPLTHETRHNFSFSQESHNFNNLSLERDDYYEEFDYGLEDLFSLCKDNQACDLEIHPTCEEVCNQSMNP